MKDCGCWPRNWFARSPAKAHPALQLQNRSTQDALVLEIGSRFPGEDAVDYPDIDLQIRKGEGRYVHRDGTAYDGAAPRR